LLSPEPVHYTGLQGIPWRAGRTQGAWAAPHKICGTSFICEI